MLCDSLKFTLPGRATALINSPYQAGRLHLDMNSFFALPLRQHFKFVKTCQIHALNSHYEVTAAMVQYHQTAHLLYISATERPA